MLEQKAGAAIKGVYTFTKAFLQTPRHFALQREILRMRAAGRPYMDLVRKLNSICRTEQLVIENLIPTVGRAAIANALTDATPSPSSILVSHVALGTGTNAPANGDTTLQTEVYRNAVASRTNANNIAYVTGFFASTETTGTYREVGLFIEASLTANSGVLFSRAAINIPKSAVQTLTIDHTITIS